MRLWHKDLISSLPRQQLLGQHRECCALRGLGWDKKHATVNYIFKYPYNRLFFYHQKVMREMLKRGYFVSYDWFIQEYRGKLIGFDNSDFTKGSCDLEYPEHNQAYLVECINNLKDKGVIL